MGVDIRSRVAIGFILSLAGVAPLLAQEASVATGTSTTAALDEITVTARRVEERLEDVPISITVFNQQQLADRNVLIATDLAAYTPSLSVNQRYGAEKASFSIRGFNQDQGTAPTVGVYFADVVGVRAQGGTTSGNTVGAGAFMDLQNVQVLKGPQGTLFGRNTTGGAILLVPNKPTDQFEGYVEASGGDYGLVSGQAVLNIPVTSALRVRLAIDRTSRDGYLHNESGIGPDDYDDTNYLAARLSVDADITANLNNYTIFTYSDSHTHGFASRLVSCNRDVSPANFVLYATAESACNQIDRQVARHDDLLDVDVGVQDPYVRQQQWQVINTTTWNASDALTVKNIASYGEFRERSHFNLYSDNFSVPAPLPNAGAPFQYLQLDRPPDQDQAHESTTTEELQLQGRMADNRLTWVLGGYLEFSRPLGFNASRTSFFGNCSSPGTLTCTTPLGFAEIFDSRTKYAFDNNGIFAQGTYEIVKSVSVTAGARETFDRINASDESVNENLLGGPPVAVCNDSLRFNTANPAGGPPFPLVVTSPAQCHKTINNDSSRPTWLLDVDYKPTDDAMLYAKYARGYRQGGISFTSPGLETWAPEKVDSYEIGSKTSFHGWIQGYFNLAAFYNNFTNQQLFGALIANPNSGQIGGVAVINAGKSHLEGIEVDSAIAPIQSLQIDLAYTWLKTKVVALTPPALGINSPYLAIIPTASVGDSLPYSPKNKVSLTGTYLLPIPESVGNVSVGATFVHTDSSIADGSVPADTGVLPATNLLNLNASWKNLLGHPIDLSLFATNVTNQLYSVGTGSGYVSSGIGDVLVGPPRMYGGRIRYSFGTRR
jgi:iron complex outermembrane receptor protein